MKLLKITAIACATLILLTGAGVAKDLRGQLGLGFNSQLSPGGMDSISGKYWLNNELGFQGILGFTMSDNVDEYDLGGKVMFKIKDEENMYVAGIGGLGLAHVNPDAGDSDTGWWASIGAGLEYFFSGLPNLGFSTELGLYISDYNDNTSFGTAADTFVSAGIHYYFGGPKVAK